MKKYKLGFVIIAFLVLAGVKTTVRCSVITVPDDYPSIEEAISNADEGDTIKIRTGEYTENITIDKRLTLEGQDSTLNGRITIDAKNVKISNIIIKNSVEGIKITSSGNAILYSLTVESCTYGIKINGSGKANIHDGIFRKCEYGVYGEKTTGIVIYNSTFSDNTNALYFLSVSGSSITNSRIENSTTGIYFSISDSVSISKSIITECEVGIDLQNSEGNIKDNFLKNDVNINLNNVKSSEISGNEIQGGTTGMLLKYSPENEISSNRIKNASSDGIRIMYQSKNCNLYNNIIYGNTYGIAVLAGCDGTKIVNNTLYSNSDKNIWLHDSQDILIQNNIIANGKYGIYPQESTLEVNYNDFWKNSKANIFGGTTGVGMYNIFYDPLFLDAKNENFKLNINSPCIDAGKFENSPGTDFEGKRRLHGKGVDLGAYELTTVQITLVANTIDYELAGEFIEFLDMNNVLITPISAADFPDHQEDKIILILGGPDAYDGIGYIVQNTLDGNEIDLIRKEGNFAMFIKTNIWKDGQLVLVLAGSDRDLTKAAWMENKGQAFTQMNEWL
ncbi:MAG: right-handed parallel beta-helix repeat-containing protein [Methanomicrobia archaeon]|nr:right-handed parallel beta-helix repeat-containing protein [Methanomicrobia archaeon]